MLFILWCPGWKPRLGWHGHEWRSNFCPSGIWLLCSVTLIVVCGERFIVLDVWSDITYPMSQHTGVYGEQLCPWNSHLLTYFKDVWMQLWHCFFLYRDEAKVFTQILNVTLWSVNGQSDRNNPFTQGWRECTALRHDITEYCPGLVSD